MSQLFGWVLLSGKGVADPSGCNPCSAGRFSSNEGASASSTCEPCEIGRYQSHEGTSTCHACPEGYGNKRSGSATCIATPPGSYVNAMNATVPCEAGFKCEGGAHGRVACPPGFYSNRNGSVSCIVCSPGRFSAATGQIECLKCREGRYQSLEGNSTCDACPEGYGNKKSGSATCIATPPGSYVNATNATVPCEAGFKCEGGAHGRVACPKGKYATNPGGVSCFGCSPGRYADTEATIKCKSCASGFYQTEEGQRECSPCREGTYSASGASECTQCDLGKYGRDSNCISCPVGLYSDTRGSTKCEVCVLGKNPMREPPRAKSLNGKSKRTANLVSMLDDTSSDKMKHSCEPCMDGADCSRRTTFSSLRPLPGYRGYSWASNESLFAKCPYPEACVNGTCDTEAGYEEDDSIAPLCGVCREGFAMESSGCVKCTNEYVGTKIAMGFVQC